MIALERDELLALCGREHRQHAFSRTRARLVERGPRTLHDRARVALRVVEDARDLFALVVVEIEPVRELFEEPFLRRATVQRRRMSVRAVVEKPDAIDCDAGGDAGDE